MKHRLVKAWIRYLFDDPGRGVMELAKSSSPSIFRSIQGFYVAGVVLFKLVATTNH